MDIQNRRAVRAAASEALAANSGDPRKVALLYVVISAASATLLSAAMNLLTGQIANLGGLSNMSLQSILSTVQSFLPAIMAVGLLGLRMGYRNAVLRMARRQDVRPRDLTEGFRCIGPALRGALLQGGLYFLLMMGAAYIAFFITMFTPLAADYRALTDPIIQDPDAFLSAMLAAPDPAFFEPYIAAVQVTLPLFLAIFCVTFPALAAPFFYRYRMTDYFILDNPRMGSRAAMRESLRMTLRKRTQLLKLDLGFWWFHLPRTILLAFAADRILTFLMGIPLPQDISAMYLASLAAALALLAALDYFFLNRVETAHAMVYDSLRPAPQPAQGGVVLGNIFDLAKDYKED